MAALIVFIIVMCSGLNNAIFNMKCMSKPVKYVNGIPIYRNRKGHDCLASGELVYWKGVRNYYGGYNQAYVTASGKILNDPIIEQKALEDKEDKKSLEMALERGRKVSTVYYPQYKKRIPTEIGTGRFVATRSLDMRGVKKYYKQYMNGPFPESGSRNWTEISEDEYHKYYCHYNPYNVYKY